MFFTSTTTTNPMKNCDMYKPVSNCRMIFQRVSVCLEAVSVAIVSHSYVIQCAIISNNIHMCPNDIFLASRAALWMSLLLNFSPTFSHPSASVNSMNISVQYVFPNCLFSLFYSLFYLLSHFTSSKQVFLLSLVFSMDGRWQTARD